MPHTTVRQLTESLQEVSQCLQQLYLLLEEEQENLRSFDFDGLLALAAKKSGVLHELGMAAARVDEYQERLATCWQIPAGPTQLQALLEMAVAKDSQGTLLTEAWQLAQDWKQKLGFLQSRNSILIGEGLAFCQDALACMHAGIAGHCQPYSATPHTVERKPGPLYLHREV
ncbi:MAG: flagellar export chaperone FlgN [Deltaproteobacteria bacterium]|nr:flagellar export chaperone FlgN [Deltaproteobacteria bacterium]MBW2069699.1 flagellar export chaperone FlgN [Deltaproteobacteria bacterium]